MQKRVLGGLALLLVLGAFAVGPSFAAPQAEPIVRHRPPGPIGPPPQVEIDLTTVDVALPAVALKQSLTAEQQRALSAVLDRHKAKLDKIVRQATKPAEVPHRAVIGAEQPSMDSAQIEQPSMDSAQIEAQLQRAQADIKASQATIAQLEKVQAQIDLELATILTPEQLALHKEATSTALKPLAIADAQLQSATAPWVKTNATPMASSSTCSIGAQYASVARYWAYHAYVNAYYNYLYYDKDSNATNALNYLNYGQYYALYSVQYLGGAFFDLIKIGSNFNGNGSKGAAAAYNTQYYTYYGYIYAYNNYYYSGGSGYAYNAYVYGLRAYQNAYPSYVYGLYCY